MAMLSAGNHALLRIILDIFNKSTCSSNGSFSARLCTRAGGNFYEDLGIPKESTQNDIKSAYYKLSMQFHPDKNRGCEAAGRKFREINRAYEVLGNHKSRRLYDKGIIQGGGHNYGDPEDMAYEYRETVPDDPETKFYKSRFKRSTVSDTLGRTPIYNFDEWSRAHYGSTFQRRQKAKEKWNKKEMDDHLGNMSTQNEIIIFGIFFCAFCAYLMFRAESSYDTPKENSDGKAEQNSEKS